MKKWLRKSSNTVLMKVVNYNYERQVFMSWKEKMKEYGGGDLAFLSVDGEAIIFVVAGDPILLEGRFKGRPSEKIGCPIVTEDGFVLFVAGKRLARKISKYEANFEDTAFIAVRHGEQNDITASYELKVYDNDPIRDRLVELRASEVNPQVIAEAVESALAVMKQ